MKNKGLGRRLLAIWLSCFVVGFSIAFFPSDGRTGRAMFSGVSPLRDRNGEWYLYFQCSGSSHNYNISTNLLDKSGLMIDPEFDLSLGWQDYVNSASIPTSLIGILSGFQLKDIMTAASEIRTGAPVLDNIKKYLYPILAGVSGFGVGLMVGEHLGPSCWSQERSFHRLAPSLEKTYLDAIRGSVVSMIDDPGYRYNSASSYGKCAGLFENIRENYGGKGDGIPDEIRGDVEYICKDIIIGSDIKGSDYDEVLLHLLKSLSHIDIFLFSRIGDGAAPANSIFSPHWVSAHYDDFYNGFILRFLREERYNNDVDHLIDENRDEYIVMMWDSIKKNISVMRDSFSNKKEYVNIIFFYICSFTSFFGLLVLYIYERGNSANKVEDLNDQNVA